MELKIWSFCLWLAEAMSWDDDGPWDDTELVIEIEIIDEAEFRNRAWLEPF